MVCIDQTGPHFGWIDLWQIRFIVNWLLRHHTCPRHPVSDEQEIDATWDELVSDKVVKKESTCLWCQSASERANIAFYMP